MSTRRVEGWSQCRIARTWVILCIKLTIRRCARYFGYPVGSNREFVKPFSLAALCFKISNLKNMAYFYFANK